MTGLLDLARTAQTILPVALTGARRSVVVLAPHPDDETLGCGATIAALAEHAIPVQVVLVTDGAASHPRSARYAPPRLAALRSAELRTALRVLAGRFARPVMELGYPDLAAPDDTHGIAAAASRIVSDIALPPGAIWTTWQGDPHPDHQRVARLALRLAAHWPDADLWAYPIWGRLQGGAPLPEAADLRRVDLPHLVRRKARAIAAHASQMSGLIDDDPTGFVMTPDHQHHFATHPEIFIRVTRDAA